jgi:hypothetical protein
MAEGRLYVVTERINPDESKQTLVEATSQAQAIRTVVGNRFSAESASARDAVRLAHTLPKVAT